MDVCPSARQFLDSQTTDVRLKLLKAVRHLGESPYLSPDDRRKRPFVAPPVLLRLYSDDTCWIVYYMDKGVLKVANIGNSSETPHLWRQ